MIKQWWFIIYPLEDKFFYVIYYGKKSNVKKSRLYYVTKPGYFSKKYAKIAAKMTIENYSR